MAKYKPKKGKRTVLVAKGTYVEVDESVTDKEAIRKYNRDRITVMDAQGHKPLNLTGKRRKRR